MAGFFAVAGIVRVPFVSWVSAGKPEYRHDPMPGDSEGVLGRFEAWVRVMGGILQTVGIEGFLSNRKAQNDAVDTETSAWQGFVEAWFDKFIASPITTADLFPLALEWMPERLGDGTERSQKSKFGRLLARHKDRVFAGHKISAAGKATTGASKGSPQYCLKPATQSNRGDLGGLVGHKPLPRVEVSEEGKYIHKGPGEENVPQVPPSPPFAFAATALRASVCDHKPALLALSDIRATLALLHERIVFLRLHEPPKGTRAALRWLSQQADKLANMADDAGLLIEGADGQPGGYQDESDPCADVALAALFAEIAEVEAGSAAGLYPAPWPPSVAPNDSSTVFAAGRLLNGKFSAPPPGPAQPEEKWEDL